MAEQGRMGHEEARRELFRKSVEDESFRQELLRNPKPVIEQAIGAPLPETVKVVVHESEPDTMHLVLPSKSHVERGFDLSDEDLEAVAWGTASCNNPLSCWGGCTETARNSGC
jgi:hypothetical protein